MPKRTKDEQMYINTHPSCEACGIIESKEYHHIITRATGGPSEDWNALALCTICHNVWHMNGRKTFCQRYPKLEPKVRDACKRLGRKF